jgi:molybdopterin molybdotransferase
VAVRVTEPISLGPALQHFLRAVVTPTDAGYDVRLTGPQGSGILTSMVTANALLIVPQGQHQTAEGARLKALLLEDPHHVAEPPW